MFPYILDFYIIDIVPLFVPNRVGGCMVLIIQDKKLTQNCGDKNPHGVIDTHKVSLKNVTV